MARPFVQKMLLGLGMVSRPPGIRKKNYGNCTELKNNAHGEEFKLLSEVTIQDGYQIRFGWSGGNNDPSTVYTLVAYGDGPPDLWRESNPSSVGSKLS